LGPGSLGDDQCQQCLAQMRKSLISATAAACIISHFLMGVVGNLPLAVAPAMGINAYFAYTVVGFMGTGRITYQQALTAAFIEGWIFILISLIGVRSWLLKVIPRCLLLSTSAGIGLFLAFIGLQQSEGIGLVTYNSATLVTLGGCSTQYRQHQFTFVGSDGGPIPAAADVCAVSPTGEAELFAPGWVPSGNYACSSAGVMRSPTMWLGIMSGFIMAVLMAKNVKGSMIIGILFATIISWIPTPGNMAAYIGDYTSVPGAKLRMQYFKKVVAVPDTSYSAGQFDWSAFNNGNLWVALITFLYVDFLDASGTFFSMANFLNNYIPNFVDSKTKTFDRQMQAYCVDGVSIVAGACLGTSPLTVYIESAAGIREGARTGVAALVISLCFLVAMFFSPLISAIPPYATGPALVLVGSMMIFNIVKIQWTNVQDAIPAFITLSIMPLTYSIAYGLIAGIMAYIIVNGLVLVWNYIQAAAFPKTVPDEAKAAGNGNALKTAWHMTANPPAPEGLVEMDDIIDHDMRRMTFRLHSAEAKLTEAGISTEDLPPLTPATESKPVAKTVDAVDAATAKV
jgi:adenine/guanine/hypoxanthine permease